MKNFYQKVEDDYNKAVKVVMSCNGEEQYVNAKQFINLFFKKWINTAKRGFLLMFDSDEEKFVWAKYQCLLTIFNKETLKFKSI